jgi:hypothetical protein
MTSRANDVFSWLGDFQVVFHWKITQMHGHKKKKSEWDKKRFKNGSSRNMWGMDDEHDVFHNPKKRRKFHNEDENSLDGEESFEEEDYEDGK